jgi:hypothetical protein
MRRTRALMIVAALTLPARASAADEPLASVAAREFDLIAAAHHALRTYDLRIDVAYSVAGTSQAFPARVACDARRRCLRVFQNATALETPELSLLVDANDRTISVAVRDPAAGETAAAQVDPTARLDAWIKGGGSLSGGELTDDGRRWAFQPAKAGLPAAQMWVDPSSHLLRRLVYEVGTGERKQVDIRYTWRDAARLDPAEFEVSRFIEGQDAAIAPAQAYATYRIIRADRR